MSLNKCHQNLLDIKLSIIVNQGQNVSIFETKYLLSGSQDLEIFFLPAMPTEHLDGHRQPHFLMCLLSLKINKILVGISATMCHSAEKIPAKEGCQYKRVST